MAEAPDPSALLSTEAELRARMPEPQARTAAKKISQFEESARFFLAHTACVGVTTERPGGGANVRACIGAPGFLYVESERTLWIPDVEGGWVGGGPDAIAGSAGLIFLVRGVRDTMRANGRVERVEGAGLPDAVRRHAERALRFELEEVYFHCPKAFLRSKLWDGGAAPEAGAPASAPIALGPDESAFLAEAPFVLLGTHAADGGADLSPRGDPPGFVRQLGSGALLLPDRPGNRIADSLRNVLETHAVGLLALVPGRAEALSISGRAELVTGDALWADSAVKGKTPDLGFWIEVLEASLHPAPALDAFWSPEGRVDAGEFPSLAELLIRQLDPNGRGKRLKTWALAGMLRRDERTNLY